MAKKRKATPQAATLLDFFGKSEYSQAQKKVKPLQDGLRVAERKRNDAVRLVPPEDIIIIDSDEENVEVVPVQRSAKPGAIKSHSASSSGRQTFPPHLPDRKRSRTEHPSGTKRDPVSAFVKTEGTTPDPEDSLFGQPSSLLIESSSGALLDDSDASFGIPLLLLSPNEPVDSAEAQRADRPDSPIQAESSHSTYNNGDSTSPHEDPGAPDEEWATGDDELDMGDPELQVKEEEDAVDIDLTLDDEDEKPSFVSHDDGVEVCPLCDKKLEGLSERDIHEHVNDCIDTMAASSGASGTRDGGAALTSELKPLYPVSSFQVPLIKQEPADIPDHASADSTGVFSVLMSSHKENQAWKEASAAEDRNFRPTKGNGGRRKAPFYKVMQGMPIAVDAFRYGTIPDVTAYFLTHAHSDHYTNLSANWKSGPIYCSEGTANLIMHMLGVGREWVHPLPMDVPTTIPNTGGVQVTLIEANHCPGSCLFLFEGPQTVDAGDSAYKSPSVGSSKIFRYLHCGDFRASPQHVLHPAIKGKRIDTVYLDTTYLDPKYCFPPQPQVVSACAELARRIVKGESLHDVDDIAKVKKNRTMDSWLTAPEKSVEKDNKAGGTLIVVGTYSIGKERIVKAIAHALQTKVFCDSRKAAILRCEADPELHAMLTTDPLEGGIHLVPLGVIASDRLKGYVERFKGHYSKAVGFRPTGWTFSAPAGTDTLPSVSAVIARSQGRTFTHAQLSPMRNSTAALQVYGVPYSEHSSFFELTCFALSLDWGRMIATVNVGSEGSRNRMGKWIERWEAERKRRARGEVVQHRAQDYW